MKKKIAIFLGLFMLAIASVAISDALHEVFDTNFVEAKEEIPMEDESSILSSFVLKI